MNDRPDPSTEEDAPKRKRFNLYDRMYNRAATAESDAHVLDKPDLPNFFKFLGRNFNRVFYLNLLMIFGNFPIFFLFLALSGYVSAESVAPCCSAYSSLRCVALVDHSAAVGSLISTYGITTAITVPTIWTYICYGLSALVLLTFGPVMCGTTYILRSMIRGEPVFLWNDFWHAIRKNLRQSMIFGAIDLLLLAMLVIDIYFYNLTYSASMVSAIMLFLSWAMLIVYFMLRMYTYLMMVTFDLSLFKLIKNSLSFVILGIKRNIMAVLGTALLLGLEFFLLSVTFTFAIGVILPLIILPGLVNLMTVYAAYPKIKSVMIDPYYKEQKPVSET